MFDPKCDKFPYPLETDKHYMPVKTHNGLVFDENYPYIDKSFGFRFKRFWIRFLIVTIVFPFLMKIRMGLRIRGRKNLRIFKKALKGGAVTCANHVHMWDYLGVMKALRYRWPHLLAWDRNISGEMSGLIRAVGGIPIPVGDVKATVAFNKAIDDHLQHGGLLHVYPEGSMWEYYAPIRPFKSGAFHFAVNNNRPVIPMGYSYRKPGFIRRVIFHQIATFTLTIGEPIMPDQTLTKAEQVNDLTIKTHEAICHLAGWSSEENYYPPIFHNNTRVDYYTKEYGKGYKGSK